MKIRSIFIAVTLFSMCSAVLADEAAFSADGKVVYLLGHYEQGKIYAVDVATGTMTDLEVKGLPAEEEISAVAVAPSGLILGGTSAIWQFSPGTDAKPIAKMEKMYVDGLAVAPPKAVVEEGTILVSGFKDPGEGNNEGKPLFGIKPGGSKLEDIFCRRVELVSGPVFSAAGHLYFAGNHDVWEGSVEPEEELRLGTLNGCRIAPLAYANTDMANGGSMGVSAIAPSGDFLYVALRGRHMGTLLRVKMPKPRYSREEDTGWHPELAEQMKIMADALNSAQIIAEGEMNGLAASPDGKSVFYRIAEVEGGQNLMLISDGGDPKKIGFEKRPEQ